MTEKERYATIGTWVEYFKSEERIRLSERTIRVRLMAAKIVGLTGRGKTGKVHQNAYFAESDVRRLCEDLLQDLPQADEEGLLIFQGVNHGTRESLSRHLGIAERTVKLRITENTPFIHAKDSCGRIRTFYPEAEIHELCQDLLENLPQANDDGVIELEGEVYGTVCSLSRRLAFSEEAIRSGITENTPSIKGKTSIGKIRPFYLESAIRDLFSDRLEDFPQANEKGLIEFDGEVYGTKRSLARLFGISERTVRLRITENTPFIRGKTRTGTIRFFYPESDIRKLCADLIAKQSKK